MLRSLAHPRFRLVLIFAGVLIGGMAALLLDPVDKGIIVPFSTGLTKLCALLIDIAGGAASASGQQLSLRGQCAVTVSNGCNAVEASLVLAAAILAFPAPFGQRLLGTAIGVGIVQAVNLLRIISLLYLSCWSARWFEFFHWYLWDAVIMLDCLLFFIGWCRWQRRPHRA